ncbi:hypothetical protein F4778DRAFT_740226 [Xylariomycetidae sp. FL2044]|nr:hypothetical protein F4778DRAFT_740226 [Xylariomycetidae sp. FL2044]
MAGNNLLSLIGWSFLPNLVTGWIQSIYYGLTIRAGDPKPQPNSPRHARHRRRIHILVVSLYLLYTIYEADYELRRAPTYYADLGVPLGASEREIKSRFRRLAALHHPDKTSTSAGGGVGGRGNGDGGDDGAQFFMQLKAASDTLVDPARRFAYERFGPEAGEWRHCVTVRDYVARGAQSLLPYYGGAAVLMFGLGLLGYMDWGRYWRWLTLAGLCVFELHAVTRPRFPWLLASVVNPLLTALTAHPPYLPFQAVALARKLSVTLHIAFSQIGPLLSSHQAGGKPAANSNNNNIGGGGSNSNSNSNPEKQLQQNLDRLEQTAWALDADALRLMDLEMAPFLGDPEAVGVVRAKLGEWLVQNTIRADPMVRDAMGRSLRKRRVDAPAGAKGNR